METSTPRILGVSINDDRLTLDLEDGRILSVPILWYPRLAYGTEEERQNGCKNDRFAETINNLAKQIQ